MSAEEEAILRELGKHTGLLRELVEQVTRLADASERQAGYAADLSDTADREATAAAWQRYKDGKGPKPE